jgi:hypothetical protein
MFCSIMAHNMQAEETDRHPPPWYPFTIARSRVLAFAPFAGPDVLRGKLTASRGASEIHEHLFPGLTMLNAGWRCSRPRYTRSGAFTHTFGGSFRPTGSPRVPASRLVARARGKKRP